MRDDLPSQRQHSRCRRSAKEVTAALPEAATEATPLDRRASEPDFATKVPTRCIAHAASDILPATGHRRKSTDMSSSPRAEIRMPWAQVPVCAQAVQPGNIRREERDKDVRSLLGARLMEIPTRHRHRGVSLRSDAPPVATGEVPRLPSSQLPTDPPEVQVTPKKQMHREASRRCLCVPSANGPDGIFMGPSAAAMATPRVQPPAMPSWQVSHPSERRSGSVAWLGQANMSDITPVGSLWIPPPRDLSPRLPRKDVEVACEGAKMHQAGHHRSSSKPSRSNSQHREVHAVSGAERLASHSGERTAPVSRPPSLHVCPTPHPTPQPTPLPALQLAPQPVARRSSRAPSDLLADGGSVQTKRMSRSKHEESKECRAKAVATMPRSRSVCKAWVPPLRSADELDFAVSEHHSVQPPARRGPRGTPPRRRQQDLPESGFARLLGRVRSAEGFQAKHAPAAFLADLLNDAPTPPWSEVHKPLPTDQQGVPPPPWSHRGSTTELTAEEQWRSMQSNLSAALGIKATGAVSASRCSKPFSAERVPRESWLEVT